jgi:regulator of cell morphogenesis and NO signaling
MNTEQSVTRIAIENPAAVRVFERLGIDYCCGANRSLADACARAKVPVESALRLLARAGESNSCMPGELWPGELWNEAPLRSLTAWIVTQHHLFVRQETPRIEAMFNKVLGRHGDSYFEVQRIEELFLVMTRDLSTHMAQEEQMLFPHIEETEAALAAGEPLPTAFFGSVASLISKMMRDHDDTGALLARIRKLTGDFTLPPGSCPTYRGLYHALAEFEADFRRHVNLENNILFPRAQRMESAALEAHLATR